MKDEPISSKLSKEELFKEFEEFRKKRERELNAEQLQKQKDEEEKALEKAKKNSPFTQLDDVGMALFIEVNQKSAKAGSLFLQLAKQMDKKGAVICSRDTLAALAQTDKNNVLRLVKILQDAGLLKTFKARGIPVYAMNQDVVWRSDAIGKQYALFSANVIMSEDEIEDNTDFDIRRGTALIEMATKKKQSKGSDKTNNQTEFKPPVGEAPEEPEIVDD